MGILERHEVSLYFSTNSRYYRNNPISMSFSRLDYTEIVNTVYDFLDGAHDKSDESEFDNLETIDTKGILDKTPRDITYHFAVAFFNKAKLWNYLNFDGDEGDDIHPFCVELYYEICRDLEIDRKDQESLEKSLMEARM